MNPPFSDREAGEVLARLANIAEAVNDLRHDFGRNESSVEIALEAQRQERMKDIDKMRGELGRRIDDVAADVKELSAYRWRIVGFCAATAVAWSVFSGLLGFYIASHS